jgi:hypothetical protein
MNKDTKVLLGIAGLALLGFFLYGKSSNDTTKSFVNASGKSGSPCTFKMDGEIVSGKVSELDNRQCFSSDGKRGLSI